MKKLLITTLVLAFTLSLALNVVADYAPDNIGVTIDGVPITFEDQGPVIVDSRTLVPVRGVFETMGFHVGWDGYTQTVTLMRPGYVVVIIIDSIVFATNKVGYELEVPAQIIADRTMLPIRAVLESVGYSLDWDSDTRTVIITSGDKTPPIEDVPTLPEPVEPEQFEVGAHFRADAQGPAAVPMPMYIVILENYEFEVWSGSPAGNGVARSRGTFTIDGNKISFSQLLVLPAEVPVPDEIEIYTFVVAATDMSGNITSFSISNGTFRWPLPTMPPVTGSGADANNQPVDNFVFNFVGL